MLWIKEWGSFWWQCFLIGWVIGYGFLKWVVGCCTMAWVLACVYDIPKVREDSLKEWEKKIKRWAVKIAWRTILFVTIAIAPVVYFHQKNVLNNEPKQANSPIYSHQIELKWHAEQLENELIEDSNKFDQGDSQQREEIRADFFNNLIPRLETIMRDIAIEGIHTNSINRLENILGDPKAGEKIRSYGLELKKLSDRLPTAEKTNDK